MIRRIPDILSPTTKFQIIDIQHSAVLKILYNIYNMYQHSKKKMIFIVLNNFVQRTYTYTVIKLIVRN